MYKVVLGIPNFNKNLKKHYIERVCGKQPTLSFGNVCQLDGCDYKGNYSTYDTCHTCQWIIHRPITEKIYNNKLEIIFDDNRIVRCYGAELHPTFKYLENSNSIFIVGNEITYIDYDESMPNNAWYKRLNIDAKNTRHIYYNMFVKNNLWREGYLGYYLIRQM